MPHCWKVLHNSCLKIQSQIQMVLANILYLVICLFVDVFMSDFFSHMEKWRTANFDLCSVIIAIEQWGFFSVHVPQTVKRGIRIYCSSPKARDTHTYCRALSSGAVTTCFKDWGLSRLGFKHPTFRLRGEYSNQLRHRGGLYLVKGDVCFRWIICFLK